MGGHPENWLEGWWLYLMRHKLCLVLFRFHLHTRGALNGGTVDPNHISGLLLTMGHFGLLNLLVLSAGERLTVSV